MEPTLLNEASKEETDQKSLSKTENNIEDCKKHFGYLSERSGKNIPDECLICKAIVQCMLKTKDDVSN